MNSTKMVGGVEFAQSKKHSLRAALISKKRDFLKAPILLPPAQEAVMKVLRKTGETSRPDISSVTGWSRAKTSQEVNVLIEKGILKETGEGASQGGRKPRLLRLNNQLGYVFGLDIGATSVDAVLADLNGNILQRKSEPADVSQPPAAILGRCQELMQELAAMENIRPEKILSIGIGVPGPVDFSLGVLVAPPLMPGWENYPIRDFFRDAFPAAMVMVDNDVNIMALGEKRSGDAANLDHFLVIKIGTGIGCGIMAGGRIHRGSDGSAGDIGHICVDKNGPICRCGNRGCLEAMAAGPAIADKAIQAAREGRSEFLRRRMDANNGTLTPEDVSVACRAGDEASLEIIRASGQMIGDVLAGLVNFFNPSQIFITGGIANFGNHLLVAVKRAVLRRSLPLATTNLTIKFSSTGSDAGVVGAVMLALEHLFVVEDQH